MIMFNMACAPESKFSKNGMLKNNNSNYFPIEIECTEHFKNNEGGPAKRSGEYSKALSLKTKITAVLENHERMLAAKEDLLANKRSLWFSSPPQISEHEVLGCVQ